MNQDSMTLYRMIVLYLLHKAAHPLSGAQIADFILEKEYTDFMTLQQVLSELTGDSFISVCPMGNRTLYTITDEGIKTLSYFESRIQPGIRNDIDCYLSEHGVEMRNDLSVLTNYDKNTSGDYTAELIAKDGESDLLRISITLPSADLAETVCRRWQKKNESIYQYLIRELL